MNAEEVKRAIRFDEIPAGADMRLLRATLQVEVIAQYSSRAAADSRGDIVAEIKERLAEDILRKLYNDQRQELYQACIELMRVDPWNCHGLAAARERLMKVATRQGGGE